MPSNLALDDELLVEAKRLGQHKTKREAVNQALAEYVASLKRRKLLDLFGQCDWDPEYDYKGERRKR